MGGEADTFKLRKKKKTKRRIVIIMRFNVWKCGSDGKKKIKLYAREMTGLEIFFFLIKYLSLLVILNTNLLSLAL